jgi:hypothetical protein
MEVSMKSLFLRPILVGVCSTFLCYGTEGFAATDEVPFPEVIPIEKPDVKPESSLAEDMAETLPWAEQLGYNSDDAYLYRIHKDAYYHLFILSDKGDVVQLHDGSTWAVHPSQQHMVLGWAMNDDLFIKPSSSCFSSYRYVLYNRNPMIQQAVEVNLISSPLPTGIYTFRIVNIEPYARLVQLSDNTVWQISSSDYHFPLWQIGQRVLVGVNNNWRTNPLPHIIINVDMYKEPYSQADFYGYPAGY